MRKIAFRLWDKEKKEMFLGAGVYPDGVGMLYTGGEHAIALYGYPIMQFTGFKDKNRVDIYENDIILYSESEMKGLKVKAEVVWGNGEWMASGTQQALAELNLSEMWEVIGNIYESPDILK